jgi:hypothetical protein
MPIKQHKPITDLKGWELPQLDAIQDQLIEELANRKIVVSLSTVLGERIHELIFDRVRELAETAINETILYWLMGLADGSDNSYDFPEMCVEFPYLHTTEGVDPLTVTYSVNSQDDTRTELNRIDLNKALMLPLEGDGMSAGIEARAKVVAERLKQLAVRLEKRAEEFAHGKVAVRAMGAV